MTRTQLLLFTLATWYVGLAEPVPIPGTQAIQPTFEQADIVCNCEVEAVSIESEHTIYRGGKPLDSRRLLATVVIKDAYKAISGAGSPLTVEYNDEIPVTIATPSLKQGASYILFLERTATDTYGIMDHTIGATLFAEIPRVQGHEGLPKLESALAEMLPYAPVVDQRNAMRLLEGLDELAPSTVSEIVPMAKSSDPEIAFTALAVVLKSDPTLGVGLLTSYLATYSGNDQHIAIASIGSELGRIKDTNAEPSLETLAFSRFLPIKFGAIRAIRGIKSPNSTQALVRLLDDPNIDIRYMAVMSLADIFGKRGDYSPTADKFDKDPEIYASIWKQWRSQQLSVRSR